MLLLQKNQLKFVEKRLVYQQNPAEHPLPNPAGLPERAPVLKGLEKPVLPLLQPVADLQGKRTDLAKQVVRAPKAGAEAKAKVATLPENKTDDTVEVPTDKPKSAEIPALSSVVPPIANTPSVVSTSPKPSSSISPTALENKPSVEKQDEIQTWLKKNLSWLPSSIAAPIFAMLGPLLKNFKPFFDILKKFGGDEEKEEAAGVNEGESNESADDSAGNDEAEEQNKTEIPSSENAPAPEPQAPPIQAQPKTETPFQGVNAAPIVAASAVAQQTETAQKVASENASPKPKATPLESAAISALLPKEKSGNVISEHYDTALTFVNTMLDPKQGGFDDYEGSDDESEAKKGLQGYLLAYCAILGEGKGKEKFNAAKKLFESTQGFLSDQKFLLSHLTENMGLGKYIEQLSDLQGEDYELKGFLGALLQIADQTLVDPRKEAVLSAYASYLNGEFKDLKNAAQMGKVKTIMAPKEFAEYFNKKESRLDISPESPLKKA